MEMTEEGMKGMEKSSINIKEEDCDWKHVHPKPESLCIKNEDYEQGTVGIKEEPEEKPVIGDIHDYKIIVKEEDFKFKSESICQYGCQDGGVSGLVCLHSRTCSVEEHSVSMKSEVYSDTETSEETSRSTAAGQPSSVSQSGKDMLEGVRFSPSLAAETSLQVRPQQTPNDENMRVLTSGSEVLARSSLQFNSVPAVPMLVFFTINNPQQVNSTPSGASPAGQEQRKSLKCQLENKGSQRSHTSQRPYGCSECGKRFNKKLHLEIHTRIHTGEKPFSCSECGKGFYEIGGLNSHMRTHTGEKPHRCPECGKQFTTRSLLHKHTSIHTVGRPFCCSECGREFLRRDNFANHMRIHSGEKPYCCSECGKGFLRRDKLADHMRMHTGEKPYGCLECGRRYSTNTNLKKHMQTHTGEAIKTEGKTPTSCSSPSPM
ncbi:zinc finger protein 235-like [Erpetoichthys calabaricus]|uniref:Zinc finger protein 235-like n=1 Tax=Erpetoichthys calabaricus TaxID=27687 RepID=A0A8C4RKQ4_ERPCA|nr:zinc finger protein 235-like [Erpetoichthys calabaricus]